MAPARVIFQMHHDDIAAIGGGLLRGKIGYE
jgi:hypothetical protein